jgi:hypothetical protein
VRGFFICAGTCAGLCAGIHFFTKSNAGVLRFALSCLRVYDYLVIKRLPRMKGARDEAICFYF